MPYKKKRRYEHTCTRCGFTSRGYRKKPRRCANRQCSSPYWNKPRQVSEEVKETLESLRFKK